jgi:hypothetical protein
MRPSEKIDSSVKKMNFSAGAKLRKQILDDALKAHQRTETQPAFEGSKQKQLGASQVSIWRIIMKSKTARISAAALVIIAAALVFEGLFNRGTTPAYAVEQTFEAIKNIQTVHMAGEFYQGKFECWMTFAGNTDSPEYLWLIIPRIPNMQRVCTPTSSHVYNPRTNVVYPCRRDERNKYWVLHFASFFEDTVERAGKTDSVNVYNETQPDNGTEVIVVHISTKNREQKLFIDPETKLPISFQTLWDNAPHELTRKGLAIKNIEWIKYNEEPPEGIFDSPGNAKVVTEEPDIYVDPDSGLAADGLTPEKACIEITTQAGQALVAGDISKFRELAPFFRVVSDETWSKAREKAKAANHLVVEFVITGSPYEEGDRWFVPCKTTYSNGTIEHTTPMIKFYKIEGRQRCYIIGSKEKGVYD